MHIKTQPLRDAADMMPSYVARKGREPMPLDWYHADSRRLNGLNSMALKNLCTRALEDNARLRGIVGLVG